MSFDPGNMIPEVVMGMSHTIWVILMTQSCTELDDSDRFSSISLSWVVCIAPFEFRGILSDPPCPSDWFMSGSRSILLRPSESDPSGFELKTEDRSTGIVSISWTDPGLKGWEAVGWDKRSSISARICFEFNSRSINLKKVYQSDFLFCFIGCLNSQSEFPISKFWFWSLNCHFWGISSKL